MRWPRRGANRLTPDAGVDPPARRRHHGHMDTPNTPRGTHHDPELEARVQAWLELKREMEALHAKVEYVRLLLKMGVRQL